MLRKYGFFILLIVIISASLIVVNAHLKTQTVTVSSFHDHIENAVTDGFGNLWALYKNNEEYTVIRYTLEGKILHITGLTKTNKDTGIISNNMYVDQNGNLFVMKSIIDKSTGLIQSETVLMLQNDTGIPVEIFRIDYQPVDNVWLPTISHIACEGNNLFIVMNEISSIKVYCVSITSKEASKTDEFIPAGDVYIDSAVRLGNGVIVFSTKEGNVYTIRNKEEAVKIYPTAGSTAKPGKLQSVIGNEIRFMDGNSGKYVSMAYMDFPVEVLLNSEDTIVSEINNIMFSDTDQIFTGADGLVVFPVTYKGDLLLLYGDIANLKILNASKAVRSVKNINTLIKVVVIFAAVCFTVVVWQTFLYFDIKYFRKKKIIVRTVKNNRPNKA